MPSLTRAGLARAALAQTFFPPTTLGLALARLGFVQADPIRAPARAQDLILRHRVTGYREGLLEARYPSLAAEEDYLVNYGFLHRAHVPLMHPRLGRRKWTPSIERRARELLAWLGPRGEARPAEVEARFGAGRVRNPWGGQSRASTALLETLHYRGLLRVARREGGLKVYAAASHQPLDLSPAERAARLLHLTLALYAPVPSASLGTLVRFLDCGAPHLRSELRAALAVARQSLPQAEVDGVRWYWPPGASPTAGPEAPDQVRLLAPFDPLVWDRRRFELLWGWAYRFEAYTPVHRRVRGYYALPLLWRDAVIGWANVSAHRTELGFVAGRPPRERSFKAALEAEEARLRGFLRDKGPSEF